MTFDYGKLQERFEQDAEALETRPLPAGLEAAAVGYWFGFPSFLSVLDAGLADHGEPASSAYWAARDALKLAHYHAAQALVGLAEKVGLDGGPIWTASRICQTVFPETERVAPGPTIRQWPEGWASRINKLPADSREAVRRGYETLVRLSERLGVSQPSASSLT